MAIQSTQVPMYTKHTLFFVFFFFFFQLFLFLFEKQNNKKKLKNQKKYKNSLRFVYIGTCVLWMAIETKFSKVHVFCNLDEHLNAQLSK